MGIAAYNRGTKVVHAHIDAKLPDHNSAVVQSINNLPRGTVKLFAPAVVRYLKTAKTWCLMNHEETGWASHCYEYPSLRALFASWDCYVFGYGEDKHSFFYRVA